MENTNNDKRIDHFRDLKVYRNALSGAAAVHTLVRGFPAEETQAMAVPLRLASRSVCAHIGRAWHRRKTKMGFISKLVQAETEAADTRVWLELARKCGYLSQADLSQLDGVYDTIIAQLTKMIRTADTWLFPARNKQADEAEGDARDGRPEKEVKGRPGARLRTGRAELQAPVVK